MLDFRFFIFFFEKSDLVENGAVQCLYDPYQI
jgi:hypothetical protein